MKNIYDFRFLPSPNDPLTDTWIGQTFALSYLNSEPGISFLFRYRPYNVLMSRVDRERRHADSSLNPTVLPRVGYGIRPDGEGIIYSRPAYSIKEKISMIMSRNFLANLDEAAAFVTVAYLMSSGYKDKQVFNNLERHEIAHRVYEYSDILKTGSYTTARRVEELQLGLELFMQIAQRKRKTDEALRDFFDLAERENFLKETVDIGRLLVAEIEKMQIRGGVTYGVTYADKAIPDLRHEAIKKGQAIISDMMLPESHIYDGNIAVAPDPRTSKAYRMPMLFDPDQRDVFMMMQESLNAQRTDHLGRINPGIVPIERFHTEGHKYMFDPVNGETTDTEGHITTLINTERLHLKQIIKTEYMNTERIAESKEMQIVQLINVEGFESRGWVHPNMMKLIERHGAEGHINNEQDILFELYKSKDSYVYESILVDRFAGDGGVVMMGHRYFEHFPRHASPRLTDQLYATHFPKRSRSVHTDNIYVDRHVESGIVYEEMKFGGHNAARAFIYETPAYTDFFTDGVTLYQPVIFGGMLSPDAMIDKTVVMLDSARAELPKHATIYQDYHFVDRVLKAATPFYGERIYAVPVLSNADVVANILYSEKTNRTTWITEQDHLLTVKIDKNSRDQKDQQEIVTKIDKTANDLPIHHFMELIPFDARVTQELSMRARKIELNAWLAKALMTLTKQEKASILRGHWEVLKKVYKEFINVDNFVRDHLAELRVKETNDLMKGMIIQDTLGGRKIEKPFMLIEDILATHPQLDTMILELMGNAKRVDYLDSILQKPNPSDRHNERIAMPTPEWLASAPDKYDREALKLTAEGGPGTKEEMIGIINEIIISHEEQYRPAIIMKDFVLTQDPSEWDDIWKRYSPGKDVIDVPNKDFDYSTLASQVYDEKGRPLFPRGPVNLPDVRVATPLHHPIPANYDLGTEEVVVDNYILIDSILAISTLMNNGKLKYAGMPAEQAIRELFSKLFAWIQGAAPGNPEYDRMFRFARWYAESIVLKLSEHILHRTYNPWKSSFHNGVGFGIEYDSSNWNYMPGAGIAQTTGPNAFISFTLETLVDSKMIVRGLLDNPTGAGIMEVYASGELLGTVATNGMFNVTYDVPMGDHLFEFVFTGTTGSASLSSMEIGGVEFVSAYTTSDDSNTNGLKAMTRLLEQLVGYFDLHHGNGKVKGTMEIKQRKVIQDN